MAADKLFRSEILQKYGALCSRIIITIIIIFTLTTTSMLLAKKSYQPIYGNSLIELWRWSSYPKLEGQGLMEISDGTDGTIWFNVAAGVYRYDGMDWQLFNTKNSPLKFDNKLDLTPVFISQDGGTYIGDTSNVYRFEKGNWQVVWPFLGKFANQIHHITESADGSFWIGTNVGIIRIKDNQPILYTSKIAKHKLAPIETECEIKIMPNLIMHKPGDIWDMGIWETGSDLWFTIELQGGQGSYILKWNDFEKSDLQLQTNIDLITSEDGLDFGSYMFVQQVDKHKAWIVSTQQQKKIYEYNKKEDTFSLLDLSQFNLTYKNFAIVQTQDGSILIGDWGKILHYKEGKWKVYDASQLPIPKVDIKMTTTSEGNLWVFGNNEIPYRVELGNRHWTTYQGLNYQCESADGKKWFITSAGQAIVKNKKWWQYDTTDGLISTPVVFASDRRGRLWAAGSHKGLAATAYLEGEQWIKQIHPELSWGVGYLAVCPLQSGGMAFGSGCEFSDFEGGVKFFRKTGSEANWHHKTGSQLPYREIYAIDQTADGRLWLGGHAVMKVSNNKTKILDYPSRLSEGWISYLYTTGQDLWVAKHGSGLFHYNGASWNHYTVDDNLASNTISSVTSMGDTIIVSSEEGISAFDGHSWTKNIFAKQFSIPLESGVLKSCSDKHLWISLASRGWYFRGLSGREFRAEKLKSFKTVVYKSDRLAPETEIVFGLKKVGPQGNIHISWQGRDQWNHSRAQDLEFSYRIDGRSWSKFIPAKRRQFLGLSNGQHVFEVRARDMDFNIDQTPAQLKFIVETPLYKKSWFIALITLMLGLIIFQTVRALSRGRNLKLRNQELVDKNQEVEDYAQALQNTNQALRESEKKYRLLVENFRDGIAIMQNDSFIYVNSAFAEMLDYSLKSLRHKKCTDIFAREYLEKLHKPKQTAGADGELDKPIRSHVKKINGDTVAVEINAKIMDYKGEFTVFAVIRDITKQKEIFKSIQESARQRIGLQNVIPICAGCNKIRDDEKNEDKWIDPAEYISARLPDVNFSHGMCPDCMKKWYPEYVEKKKDS